MLIADHVTVALKLHDIARLMRYRFDARTRSLGVTRQQWRVLFTLARNQGQTQSELADLLDVERITLCRMVDRLSEAGLVERRADPNDRRVWRLHLLPGAQPIVDQLTAIGAELEKETLECLGDRAPAFLEDLDQLRCGLRNDSRKNVA